MHEHLMSLKQSTLKQQTTPMEEIDLIGSVDAVVERAKRLEEAGVTHLLGLMSRSTPSRNRSTRCSCSPKRS